MHSLHFHQDLKFTRCKKTQLSTDKKLIHRCMYKAFFGSLDKFKGLTKCQNSSGEKFRSKTKHSRQFQYVDFFCGILGTLNRSVHVKVLKQIISAELVQWFFIFRPHINMEGKSCTFLERFLRLFTN